jgi:hypothetical protein
MSTLRSVDRSAVAPDKDRLAVAHEKDRLAVAHEKDRLAVAHEKDRLAVAHEKDRSAVAREKDRSAVSSERNRCARAHEKDRSALCSFTFADGRRCLSPRQTAPQSLFCCFHARKLAQDQTADQLGRDISYLFSAHYLSACDLSAVLGRIIAAVAQGHVKPKTAATLAYLGNTLLQTIHVAQKEYIEAFGFNAWRNTVHSSVDSNCDYLTGTPDPAPTEPAPEETPATEEPQPSTQPAALPATSSESTLSIRSDANPERAERVEGSQHIHNSSRINTEHPIGCES